MEAAKLLKKQTKSGQPLWYWSLLLLIFVIGCFVRIYGIGTLFTGLNQDEASIGYDAFAIAGWGIDRHGVTMPAYLIAWGSGQNAGYAYLLVPFIKLFGLSLTTLRLPMALVGCVSMVALYTILKRSNSRRLVLLGVFLLAICPWHILKSRWALESNLLPDMLLWGIAFFCAGIASYKKRYFYLGFAVLGLSAWAYATSFFVLSFFILPVAFVLWRRRYLSIPHIIGCFALLAAMAWPIILFSLVTLLGLPSISTPFFTIPAMLHSRTAEFFFLSDAPVTSLLQNIKYTVQLVISQDDQLLLNSVQGFGLVYLFSLPLVVVGFLRSVLPRQKGGKYRGVVPGSWLFLPLLFSGILLSVSIYGNINRLNALWMPVIWYWILGAYELICVDKIWQKVVVGFYSVFFVLYCNTLFGNHMEQINRSNYGGMLEAVAYADTLDTEVYVSPVHETYIRILFATQMPPQEYLDSNPVIEDGVDGTTLEFGKWHCADIPEPPPAGEYAAVVRTENTPLYQEQGWQVTSFGDFSVIVPPA